MVVSHHVSADTQTLVLWKSKECSKLLSHLSKSMGCFMNPSVILCSSQANLLCVVPVLCAAQRNTTDFVLTNLYFYENNKYCRIGIYSRSLLFTVATAKSSQIKASADKRPWGLFYSHYYSKGERVKKLPLASSIRASISFKRYLSNGITCRRFPSSSNHLQGSVSAYRWEWRMNTQSIRILHSNIPLHSQLWT